MGDLLEFDGTDEAARWRQPPPQRAKAVPAPRNYTTRVVVSNKGNVVLRNMSFNNETVRSLLAFSDAQVEVEVQKSPGEFVNYTVYDLGIQVFRRHPSRLRTGELYETRELASRAAQRLARLENLGESIAAQQGSFDAARDTGGEESINHWDPDLVARVSRVTGLNEERVVALLADSPSERRATAASRFVAYAAIVVATVLLAVVDSVVVQGGLLLLFAVVAVGYSIALARTRPTDASG